MPSNLRDFMNKNNINGSSRQSQEFRRMAPIEEERYNQQGNIQGRYQPQLGSQYSPNYQTSTYQAPPPVGGYSQGLNYQQGQILKYQKSKNQCIEELTRYLDEIDRKEGTIRGMVDSHNAGVLKKFSDEYDNLSQQTIRTVEAQLRDNKERLLRQIKERRNADLAQIRPIRRNMDKLKSQLTTLRDGLYRDNDYRQYISKIVLKDWQLDLSYIQQDIDRLRLPNVDLTLDEKYYSCFKNDLNRLIVVRDELQLRSNNQQNSYSPQSPNPSFSQMGYNQGYNELNPHTNRDQIKRSQINRNP